jgi:hypothetical protein
VDCTDLPAFEQRCGISAAAVLRDEFSSPAPAALLVNIKTLAVAEIDRVLDRLRLRNYVCYATTDSPRLLAIERSFGNVHFGIL